MTTPAPPFTRRARRRRLRGLGDETATWEQVREGVLSSPGVTIDVDPATGDPVQTVTVTPPVTPNWWWLVGVLAVVAVLWVASD